MHFEVEWAQVKIVADALESDTPTIVSVFAGRAADTGVDPIPIMKNCVENLKHKPYAELLWASSRETLNIFQANDIGCDIITVAHSTLNNLNLIGKDLLEYSLDTVKIFYNDAKNSGYVI